MPVTDYSKWASMDYGDDDDDDDRPRKPRVTKLEGPSKITLGAPEPSPATALAAVKPGTNASAKAASALPTKAKSPPAPKRPGLDYSKWDRWDHLDGVSDLSSEEEVDEADHEDALDEDEQRKLREVMTEAAPPPPPPPALGASSTVSDDPATRLALRQKLLSRNGAVREAYLWRQTADEVDLGIFVPAGTRGKEMRPELILAAPDTDSRERLVIHRAGGGTPFFDAELAYPVEQQGQETQDEELQWEVTDWEPDGGRRLVQISLRKKSPQGVIIWWERAFPGEEAIDTAAIPDRKWADKIPANRQKWDEANRLFRETVAKRNPIPIEIDSEAHSGTADQAAPADVDDDRDVDESSPVEMTD